ncbi:MAG: methyltransferase domain-containing protein [Streptomycetales bacterium]
MTEATTSDTPQAVELRAKMVEDLAASGDLSDPTWQRAFAAVPRHALVPRFYRQVLADGQVHNKPVDGADPSRRDEWLAAVYADRTLLTRPADPEAGTPPSSGTMPSLTALMLQGLDVADGHRVLDVGTGTGYGTALLCERLGSSNVTSIDRDEEITGPARRRLADAGYHPTIITADGAHGCLDRAPFDRIIATCSVRSIPHAWLVQTRSGGKILAPLVAGLALVEVHDDHTARGGFLPNPAYFMPLLSEPSTSVPHQDDPHTGPEHPSRKSQLPGRVVYDNHFRLILELAHPGLTYHHDQDPDHAYLQHLDGSTARLRPAPGGARVTQTGPRHLWDAIESTHAWWKDIGQPRRERFRLTLTTDRQTVWLDHPGGGHTWQLPHDSHTGHHDQ